MVLCSSQWITSGGPWCWFIPLTLCSTLSNWLRCGVYPISPLSYRFSHCNEYMWRDIYSVNILFFKFSSTSFGIYCLNKLLLLWGVFILKSKSDHIIPGQSPHSFWHNRSSIIFPHLPIIAYFYPYFNLMVWSFWIIYNSSNKGFRFTSLCLLMCFYFPWNKLSVSYNKFQLILQDFTWVLYFILSP